MHALCTLAYWPQLNGELLKKFIVDIRKQFTIFKSIIYSDLSLSTVLQISYFFLEWWWSSYLLDVLVFSCCVKSFHKVCSIKQYQVLFHSSVVRHRSMTWFVNLLILSCGQNQNVESMHPHVLIGLLFQTHSGCQQNLVPCSHRDEVSVLFLGLRCGLLPVLAPKPWVKNLPLFESLLYFKSLQELNSFKAELILLARLTWDNVLSRISWLETIILSIELFHRGMFHREYALTG